LVSVVSPAAKGNLIGRETETRRRRHGPDLKKRVVIKVIKRENRINELAALYQIHPNQFGAWRRKALEALP